MKVLDFGLAKAIDAAPAGDAANSPTLTRAATEAGAILGTAAYMAPEQANGKEADRKADVWAFGCVLYEMLTGRAVFEGEYGWRDSRWSLQGGTGLAEAPGRDT